MNSKRNPAPNTKPSTASSTTARSNCPSEKAPNTATLHAWHEARPEAEVVSFLADKGGERPQTLREYACASCLSMELREPAHPPAERSRPDAEGRSAPVGVLPVDGMAWFIEAARRLGATGHTCQLFAMCAAVHTRKRHVPTGAIQYRLFHNDKEKGNSICAQSRASLPHPPDSGSCCTTFIVSRWVARPIHVGAQNTTRHNLDLTLPVDRRALTPLVDGCTPNTECGSEFLDPFEVGHGLVCGHGKGIACYPNTRQPCYSD